MAIYFEAKGTGVPSKIKLDNIGSILKKKEKKHGNLWR
jgi:hypothetical protein